MGDLMGSYRLKDYPGVFIHIPKTGGTSIRTGYFRGRYERVIHSGLPDDHEDRFVFAFVRNPFDRAVSAWLFSQRGGQDRGIDARHRGWFDKPVSLREFLNIAQQSWADENLLDKTAHHTLPMTHPHWCLDKADFIGSFENIQTDWKLVCTRLGCPYRPLKVMNWTDRKDDYRSLINAADRSTIERLYAKDLEEFGYEF